MKKEYEGVKYEPTYQTNVGKETEGKKNPNQKVGSYANNKNPDKKNQTNSNVNQGNKKKEIYKNYQDSNFFITTPVNEGTKESGISKYKYIIIMIVLVIAAVSIMIFAFQKAYVKDPSIQNQTSDNTDKTSDNRYNTQTTGVIKNIDAIKDTITIYDIKQGKESTFSYNEGTYIYNKYDKALSIKQVDLGEIMDVYYDNTTNRIDKLSVSSDAWEYKGVKNLVVNQSKKQMSIGTTNYKYDDSIIISSDGNLVNLMDINNKDELIVKGYNKQIYSIIVDKGHGYIRFTNYEDFIGGTVEVGHDIIMPIVDNMLIVATEGDYKLTMSNGNFIGTKTISVLRDKELTVDMGDFIKPATKNASVEFNIHPNGADLYINGKLTDYDEPVKLDYGEYNIQVELNGYNTYTGQLNVDSPSMSIAVDLVEASKDEGTSDSTDTTNNSNTDNNNTDNNNTSSDSSTNTDNSSSSTTGDVSTSDSSSSTSTDSSSTSGSTTTDTTSTLPKTVDQSHTITVQGPEGAEVYLDGTLKGTAPVTFIKVIGTHIVTIRKTGYINKSYTIVTQDDSQNVSFSFPELILSVD